MVKFISDLEPIMLALFILGNIIATIGLIFFVKAIWNATPENKLTKQKVLSLIILFLGHIISSVVLAYK